MLGRLAVDGDVTVPLRAQATALAAEINFVARDYIRADNEEKRAADWRRQRPSGGRRLRSCVRSRRRSRARRWAVRCSATRRSPPAPIRC